MLRSHPKKEEQTTLRPVGIALAAVVAGLSAGKATPAETRPHAPLKPATQEKAYVLDHTNRPEFEQDPEMVVDRSDAVEPLRKP